MSWRTMITYAAWAMLAAALPEDLLALDTASVELESTSLLQRGAETVQQQGRKKMPAVLALDASLPDVALELHSVRPSVWAVAAVTVMYFAAYAILAVVHAFNQAQGTGAGPFEKALESAVMGVCFAPMLCTLFLCVYKRADTLSKGEPGKYDLPPAYVRYAMPACVIAFGVQMVLYIIREWTINKYAARGLSMSAPAFWNTVSNIAMLAMYAAAGFIIAGLVLMQQPSELVQQEGPLDISTGVFCSNCLVVLYFAVYAALHVAKTLDIWHLGRGSHPEALQDPFRYVIEVLKIAASSMQLAPMLAVVFIGVQLTIDASKETMPGAVETSMYLCCLALFVQVAVAIITPFITKAELKVAAGRLDIVDFVTDRERLFNLMSMVRAVCMAVLYCGIVVVCAYLWSQKEEPIWVILVTHLATYFFVVYAFLWLCVTFRQIADGGLNSGIRTLTTAKDTVALCPMLAVLFMECWVKSSSMTNVLGRPGEPQGFSQDYMFVATWALLFQLVLCFFNGLVFTLPKDSKVMRGCGNFVRAGLSTISVLFYLTMVTVYACIFVVLVSLFTNTPQTATGTGAWFT